MADSELASIVHVDIPVDFPRSPRPVPATVVPIPATGPAGADAVAWWTTAVAVLVHRYTGDTEIPLIGDDLGDGTIAVHVADIGPDDTVAEARAHVRAALAESVAVPRPVLTAGGQASAAAQVSVAVAREPDESRTFPETDLVVTVAEDGHTALLAAAGDLWSAETATRMARHLGRIAEALADPDTVVARAALLTPDERRLMVEDWNASDTEWPEVGYLDLLDERVKRHPDRPAVVGSGGGSGRSVTFAELDDASDRIARRLRGIGAVPGERVGLLAPRSVDFVVAAIGILKTGAAIVPFDPVNPDARLASMVADSEPVAVLALAEQRARVPEGVAFLALDDGAFDPGPADGPAGRIPVEITPDTVSHLIYTSGSTGEPKAVLERHRALVNLVHWTERAYGVRDGDHASWLSTPGFAVQIMEWMPYLALGATVHVADATERTPEQVRDWLVAEGVTHTMLVAALAERVWALRWPASAALRIMVTTAERVHGWPPVDTAFRVVMTFGSTETTNVLTCLDIGAGLDLTAQATPAEVRASRPVPVGRPISNLRVYLLDAADQPVPVGVVGRLHVAGAGLAAGYHRRDELTAARFRKNPIPEEPSSVLYDTGDLARYRDGGVVELLGRADSQVKIRGFRVELGEVETAVRKAPHVAEAAVTTRESGAGDRELVAYVAPEPGGRIEPRALRGYLAQRLPHYMVPSTVITVPGLPRLPNGKLDIRALPTDLPGDGAATEPAAPTGEVEAGLVRIWSRLFRIERVGVHDNFFDLGGYSLLAFRLIDEIRTGFGVELSLPDLYRSPTIAALAELVAAGEEREAGFGGMAPIVPDPEHRFDPFPLTDSQQALWIGRGDAVELGNVGCHGYFEWDGDLEPERFKVAWRALVDRHDALRTVIQPDGTQRVLREPPEYEVTVLDLRDADPAEAHTVLSELRERLAHQVMADDQWPLFDVRLSLLPAGTEPDGGPGPAPGPAPRRRTRLHLSLDFLISDAWSYFQVLVPDLVQLYEHPETPLPDLSLTFRDYVTGINDRLPDSDVYRRSQLYWRDRLATLPPAPKLPSRPADQPVLPIMFDRCDHTLDRASWDHLVARGNEIGVTGSVLLAAVFTEVLRTWSGQKRFTLNFPLFNRLPLHPDSHRIIGDTTTTLLLAADKSDGTFAQRAVALQEQLWADLEHRFFSGVQVLRELTRQRGTMAAAMPIVMTSLAGHPPRHYAASLGEAVYSISQTPQVEIDFQVFEVAGELRFNWDYLPALFPDGLVEEMFGEYCGILHRLIDDSDAWDATSFDGGPGGEPAGHGSEHGPEPIPAIPARAPSSSTARSSRETGAAWEKFWSGVERTGAGGDVLWDPDNRDEIDGCLAECRWSMNPALPVVDVGCGNGRFTRAFATGFPAAVGIDVSPSAIQQAEAESEGLARVSFRVLDITRPGEAAALADEIGDANVFVRGVLHVLDDEGRTALAAALAELTGGRGTVMIREPVYQGGSFGYVGHVGGVRGRTAALVGPLERAGVGSSSRFEDAELAHYFPETAGWSRLAAGPSALQVVDPEQAGNVLEVPGFFAVLARAGGSR